jgi:glycosyltransferase involved in cell wall biosynthesis
MISVVTPSFRQLDWLRLCIRSIADQEGVEVEHIVQDGGTDGVEAMIRSDSGAARVKLFVEEDAGMYDAINRGLDKAQGEICAYLNSDEQYLPGTLRTVADYFRTHSGLDVLFADAVLISATGIPLSYRRVVAPTLAHLRVTDLNTLTCATFFSRRVIEAGHRFPTHLKIAGDQHWVFELLKAGAKVAVLPEPLSVFTFTGANLSHSERAAAEKFGWLPEEEKPRRWLTPFIVAWHRFRKFVAGAYRHRDVTVQIYTKESPHQRCKISARHVGFRWPRSTEVGRS